MAKQSQQTAGDDSFSLTNDEVIAALDRATASIRDALTTAVAIHQTATITPDAARQASFSESLRTMLPQLRGTLSAALDKAESAFAPYAVPLRAVSDSDCAHDAALCYVRKVLGVFDPPLRARLPATLTAEALWQRQLSQTAPADFDGWRNRMAVEIARAKSLLWRDNQAAPPSPPADETPAPGATDISAAQTEPDDPPAAAEAQPRKPRQQRLSAAEKERRVAAFLTANLHRAAEVTGEEVCRETGINTLSTLSGLQAWQDVQDVRKADGPKAAKPIRLREAILNNLTAEAGDDELADLLADAKADPTRVQKTLETKLAGPERDRVWKAMEAYMTDAPDGPLAHIISTIDPLLLGNPR